MLRTTRLAVGAAAVLFGGVVLAQQPKDTAVADGYFPLKPKTKWTYKVQDQIVEVAVVGPEKFGTEECVKMDTLVNGKVVASELYAVKADGVYRVKVKDDKIDPPVKVLPLPLKKGDAWKINSKVGTQTVSGEFKIKGDEKVDTPAGKFDNVMLVEGTDLDVAGTKTTVKMWLAKDKGIVKLSYKINDAEQVLELKQFDPPPATGASN
jgi:hypothetical protein